MHGIKAPVIVIDALLAPLKLNSCTLAHIVEEKGIDTRFFTAEYIGLIIHGFEEEEEDAVIIMK